MDPEKTEKHQEQQTHHTHDPVPRVRDSSGLGPADFMLYFTPMTFPPTTSFT